MTRNSLLGGAIGGLVGGIVFGVILQATGLIAGVGGLVGAAGVGVGWVTLLVVMTVLGLVYAATFGRLERNWGTGELYGLAHGLVWWILGALIIMPLVTGEALFAMTQANWVNLLGYLVYGLIVGLVHHAMVEQRLPVRG